MQRLDKIISSQFNISRSVARTAVRRGKVTVGGEVVRDPSYSTDPEKEQIAYCGQALKYKKHIYLVLNKPKGVLSASTDKNRQTVVDLVPENLKRAGLAPVGRLDRDTTGLLLITDDGEFAHKVISPKSEILKTYDVVLDGEITPNVKEEFLNGITLVDGTKCKSALLEITAPKKARVKISEGKYHQIKRMFGVLGLGVEDLKRVSVGNFSLPLDIKEGECREITQEEKNSIFMA